MVTFANRLFKMNIPSSWLTWFLVIWCVLFGYALISRLLRLKGKPGGLIEPRPEDIVFDETYASALSHKSTFTRLGGGSRCMRISITKSALFIRPHFPFSLVGADADLVHEIPLSSVTDISESPEGSRPFITVRFGENRRVDLVLKRTAEFWTALNRCLANEKGAR